MARARYRRKAYSYTNKRGKRVNVPARAGATAPGKRKSAFKVDSPLKSVIPTPGRLLGKVSTKQGTQRLTQRGATKNLVKRKGRKAVRKVIPGTSIIKIRGR